MKYGRAGHLLRAIILLAAVVMAFIIASAAIRYNHQAGLFDARPPKPAKEGPLYVPTTTGQLTERGGFGER